MEAETVILGVYLILALLVIMIFYLSDGDLRKQVQELSEENEKLKSENEELEDRNGELKKEIKFMEKNNNISNQLDRMNSLLEAELNYTIRRGGLL